MSEPLTPEEALGRIERSLDRLVEEYGDNALTTTSIHDIAEWIAAALAARASASTESEGDTNA